MIDEFKRTLDILNDLNKKCKEEKDCEIIDEKEFKEQYENINDLPKMFKDMRNVLNKFENCKEKTYTQNLDELIELHIKYSDYRSEIKEIHELIKKMIGGLSDYREKDDSEN